MRVFSELKNPTKYLIKTRIASAKSPLWYLMLLWKGSMNVYFLLKLETNFTWERGEEIAWATWSPTERFNCTAFATSLKIVFSVGNGFALYRLLSCCPGTAFQIDMCNFSVCLRKSCCIFEWWRLPGGLACWSCCTQLVDIQFHAAIR